VLTIDFTSENSLVAEGVFDYSPCTVTIGPNTGSVTGCTGSTTDTKKIGLLTTAEYVTPNGTHIDGVGITPDFVVGNVEGYDAQLSKAKEILTSGNITKD